MLIEEKKIGSVIKRLFTGNTTELLQEILQNAQRAGATVLEIETNIADGTVVFRDNGTGLADNAGTAEQFLPVLTIARSSYENAQVEMQNCMGIGFYSLLAKEGVSRVEIASHNLALDLETKSLWEQNTSFWDDWREEVTATDFAGGFRLTVAAETAIITEIEQILREESPKGKYQQFKSPARGYFDIMKITLNGAEVETTNPAKVDKYDLDIAELTFRGEKLTVGYNDTESASIVNWYGQNIPTRRISNFKYYLHVRAGTPLTPMSPTRNGIVADKLLEELEMVVRCVITAFVSDPDNRKYIKSQMIADLKRTDYKYFMHDCPYYTGARILYTESPASMQNFDELTSVEGSNVLTYEEHQMILEDGVYVSNPHASYGENHFFQTIDGGEDETFCRMNYGYSTFIPMIGDFYQMYNGNPARLSKRYLFWRVGEQLGERYFFGKGEYALGETGDIVPANFQPVTCEENVFAFDSAQNWDIGECRDLAVGISGGIKDKLMFFDVEAWALWDSENDEASYDEMFDRFQDNLAVEKNALFEDTIEEAVIDQYKIKDRLGLQISEDIKIIEFKRTPDGKPEGIRVQTIGGKTIERTWLSNRVAQVA